MFIIFINILKQRLQSLICMSCVLDINEDQLHRTDKHAKKEKSLVARL